MNNFIQLTKRRQKRKILIKVEHIISVEEGVDGCTIQVRDIKPIFVEEPYEVVHKNMKRLVEE